MDIGKIRGVRNGLIILTMKGVFGQIGEMLEIWGSIRGLAGLLGATCVFRYIPPLLSTCWLCIPNTSPPSVWGISLISSHSPLPCSMFICSTVDFQFSFMVYLIFSLIGISLAFLPIVRVLTYIQVLFTLLTAFKPSLTMLETHTTI